MSASVSNLAAYAGRMRRINLLRAHGSPSGYLYPDHGCRCVACRAASAEHSRKYHASHREESAERKRKYNAEHREEIAEHKRKYRAAHAEERAEYDRLYYQAHREETAAYNHEYHAEHAEEKTARNRAAKARKRNATGTHTAADVKAQYKRQHGKCFWRKVNPACAVSLKGGHHVDHVIPLAGDRTSSNGPENIVLSCPKCNGSKAAKDPMDWAGMML